MRAKGSPSIIKPFAVEPLVGRVTHLQRQPSVCCLESCPFDEARDQTRAWHSERKARVGAVKDALFAAE